MEDRQPIYSLNNSQDGLVSGEPSPEEQEWTDKGKSKK